METKDKELLLTDLCARLPYGVKAKYYDPEAKRTTCDEIDDIYCTTSIDHVEVGIGQYGLYLTDVKPYLFPMSSMTEEQCRDLRNLINTGQNDNNEFMRSLCRIEFYHKHHIDYRGFIEKGLALDATGLNIY